MRSELDIAAALEDSLAEERKAPCGCGGGKSSREPFGDLLPFATAPGTGLFDSLSAELESALADESLTDGPQRLDDNPFADLEALDPHENPLTLENLLSLAERAPGLKITLSF